MQTLKKKAKSDSNSRMKSLKVPLTEESTCYDLLKLLLSKEFERKAVVSLIEQGCPVNKVDVTISEITALHIAVARDDLDLVELLVGRNASMTAKNKQGDTPLHLAFKRNLKEIVNFLLPLSKDCYLVDINGLTNLHIACAEGQLEVAISLVKNGHAEVNENVDFNSKNWPGFTPLHFSVQRYLPDVTQWLIDEDADVNAATANGSRPLHLAFCSAPCSKILVSHPTIETKNHVDDRGLSYLHVAAYHGYFKFMKKLLRTKNSNINVQIHKGSLKFAGYTALHFAVLNNHKEAVRLLLKYDADFTIQEEEAAYSPLHIAIYNKRQDIIELILSWNSSNFYVNPTDTQDLSHLHIACSINAKDAVKNLLKAETPDVNAQVSETSEVWPGLTALHIAIEYNLTAIIQLLLDANVDPNTTDRENMTPLHYACRFDDLKFLRLCPTIRNEETNIVKLLLKYGVSVNVQDKTGKTPLLLLYNKVKADLINSSIQVELMEKRFSITRILIDYGADVNAIYEDGSTVLHLLTRISQYPNVSTMINFLLKNYADANIRDKYGQTPLLIVTSGTCIKKSIPCTQNKISSKKRKRKYK